MKRVATFIIAGLVLMTVTTEAQKVSDSLFKKRKTILFATGATLYSGTMLALYNAWYKDYPQASFHFINDNKEWQQSDKLGHALTAYYLSHVGYHSFKWAGYEDKKAIVYGGMTGFMFQTVIEILDGFSAEWGASSGDLIANTTGATLFISQQLLWQEQRISLKFSYHPTSFPDYRPDLLGSVWTEQVLKDYNGHTYWLSGNLKSFIPESGIPDWLNMAIGYNGHGMTGAEKNTTYYNGRVIPHFDRQRRFLLSPDIDWSRIKTRKQWLKHLFKALQIVKFPLPTLEWSPKNGTKGHLLYF
jgi:hypothetical protein